MIAVAVAFLSTLVGVGAAQQRSDCASCHAAQGTPEFDPGQELYSTLTPFTRSHLTDWENSPHGQNRVGCEACHGGNPETFERLQAHEGVLSSNNPASPVHRANIPSSCGRCHTGQYLAFQRSRHFELLEQGDRRGPVCTTCHSEVAARLLSPRGLERQCAECHGPDGRAPRPGRSEDARLLLESVNDVRASLGVARRLLDGVRDQARRDQLEEAYQQAEVPLVQAVQSAHQFVFEALRERLSVARQRTAALLEALANPR